jgi:hypothetical protein
MKIRLTIDIFSGRPNPTLILDGTKATTLFNKVSLESGFKQNTDANPPEPLNLGYRGVIVEQLEGAKSDFPLKFRITPYRAYAGDDSASLKDTDFEKNLFDLLDGFKGIGNKVKFKKFLDEQIQVLRVERATSLPTIPIRPIIDLCKCAPDADLAWWNDGGQRQSHNNCYNYATNYRSDSFAQPGRAASAMYSSLSGCVVPAGQRSAKTGAIADGLVDTPTANNICPSKGHLVALVIAPGYDFHWYRKGSDGNWSHKPGGTQARLTDNAGNPIPDPRTANRGPYTQFCTFMQVIDGHVYLK